jgi:hypothetical protein
MTTCNVQYTAPADPRGGKIHHVFRCDRPRGHEGSHQQMFPAASLTTSTTITRSLRAAAVIAPKDRQA